MSRKRYLQVKNFDALQHYKDRNPIWIKLHCAILEDYEFQQLRDAAKFHIVGLSLLASRLNNRFPDDAKWLAAKIGATEEIEIETLIESGFLEVIREEKAEKSAQEINGCKPQKTKDESASAIENELENAASPEHNRTEENKTHTEQTRAALSEEKEETAVRVNFENFPKQNGHRSQFSLDECLKYVQICAREGEPVKNAKGLASHLYKTGDSDAFILATLYPEKRADAMREIYGEPRKFTEEPCAVCFGSKMEVVSGRGARPCPHCKNERGHSTGKQPEGEKENE